GHGEASVAAAVADQMGRVAYAHGTMFASEALEAYADELAPLLPLDDPRIYPVSGGSEGVETALKMARATRLARAGGRGTARRSRPPSRWPAPTTWPGARTATG